MHIMPIRMITRMKSITAKGIVRLPNDFETNEVMRDITPKKIRSEIAITYEIIGINFGRQWVIDILKSPHPRAMMKV